jgi:hypothetical protein
MSPSIRFRMTALAGGKVKRTVSTVRGFRRVTGEFAVGVAVKPHQAAGEGGAEIAEVGREVCHPGVDSGHGAIICLRPGRRIPLGSTPPDAPERRDMAWRLVQVRLPAG